MDSTNVAATTQRIAYSDFVSRMFPDGLDEASSGPGGGARSPAPHPHEIQGADLFPVCGDGERTAQLTKIAGTLIARRNPLDQVKQVALWWNERNNPPLDDSKVLETCESIYRTHERKRPEAASPETARSLEPLFPPEAASIEVLLKTNPVPHEWLIEDLFPVRKVGAVVAPGGTGKSQFLLQLAIAVATGTDLCGCWKTGKQRKVLYVAAEDDYEEIQRRLHRTLVHLRTRVPALALEDLAKQLFIVSRVGEGNLLTTVPRNSREAEPTDYVARLALAVEGLGGVDLVILDPVSRFRGGDENTAQDATRFVEALEQIPKRTDAGVLVAHHTNKASLNGEQNQHAARGSSAFSDGIRFQWNLARPPKDKSTKDTLDWLKEGGAKDVDSLFLIATVTKNNYARPTCPVTLTRADDGVLEVLHKVRPAGQDDAILERIKEIIKREAAQGRHYTRNKFEETFGGTQAELKVGQTAVREILNTAVKAGDLVLGEKRRLAVKKELPVTFDAPPEKSDGT